MRPRTGCGGPGSVNDYESSGCTVDSVGRAWVDEELLRGDDSHVCLCLDRPLSRIDLRRLVAESEHRLRIAGLREGGAIALNLPPSLAFITNLLAGWRIGAQVMLFDHRLSRYEVEEATRRLAPQLVVTPSTPPSGPLRAFFDVQETITAYAGQPAQTPHAVVQLSSGSTGPSKIIGRTAGNLVEEVYRYAQIGPGVPAPGERIVVLASMVHVLGLVGGLLYGLHAGLRLDIPERMTTDSIFKTIAADSTPTTILGVPFHIELLASVVEPPALPQLTGMTTGGELVRATVYDAFVDRYQVRLGNMYGMTEVGVIATDLFGANRPAVMPAPGIPVRVVDGELQVGMPASPYIGLVDPTRWSDGWLRTRDAGAVDPETGLVTISGRRDSQVSVGGLKVDLTEVEHTLAALPEVLAAVVTYDGRIEAYVMLREPGDPDARAAVETAMTQRLAAYKRPRTYHYLDQMPRTATGKLVRDRSVLQAALQA